MSASEPSLGNITKFSTAGDFTAEYGVVALRFYLLEIARGLLPDERIKVCWRYPLPERKAIEIIYSQERQCARANGTMKCGSGWVCPVCMRYIAERRRLELEKALANSKDRYFSVMVTYTARHTQADRLAPLLKRMISAYGHTFEGRWWTDVKYEYMLKGAIRSTEITYGENGWHPHFHVIMMVDRAMLEESYAGSPVEYAQSLQTQVGTRWLEMLDREGLTGSNRRAIDVRTADDQIAEYISKFGRMPHDWSMQADPYEIAYSTAKTPKNGNFGVLDILFAAADNQRYANLFKEYYSATKGKSQLHWAKGLKSDLDVQVIRDALAAEGIETETDILLAEIDLELWRYISRMGFIGQVMTYANTGDATKLSTLLNRLRERLEKETTILPHWDLGH